MKRDPRETKLPLWAQDVINEERKNGALHWPTEPRPEPIAVFNDGRLVGGDKPADDTCIWKVESGFGNTYVPSKRFFQKGVLYLYVTADLKGFSVRPSGEYFATERDAVLEAWWMTAGTAANALHTLKERADEI